MTVLDVSALLVGVVIGSFLNVCIVRLPRGQSVVSPRSRCPNCNHAIAAWENIPVISFLLLRGRCSGCGESISWRYPLVEIANGLLFFLLFQKYGLTPAFGVNALLVSGLLVLTLVDIYDRLLPDVITLGGAAVGFILAPLQSPEFFGAGLDRLAHSYWNSFLGALIGGGVLWAVAEAYLRLKKVEGMGFGDVKMMMLIGAFLGWRFAWLTILLGSLSGAVVGVLYIWLSGKGRKYELPFGTFLGICAIICVFSGRQIIDWYLGP